MTRQVTHKIRASATDGGALVKMLIQHPMETGNRKDRITGLRIPRHFIREMHCEHNGAIVMTAFWSWGMAPNPYLSFRLRKANRGDTVKVRWWDSEGKTETIETRIR